LVIMRGAANGFESGFSEFIGLKTDKSTIP
jgi:hypothetical protein